MFPDVNHFIIQTSLIFQNYIRKSKVSFEFFEPMAEPVEASYWFVYLFNCLHDDNS